MKKRNQFAKDLFSPKYRKRIVKPKKGKVLKEKKIEVYLFNLAPIICITFDDISVPFLNSL